MPKQHTFEDIATQVADYIEETAQAIAAAMREGRASPFAPTLSRAQILAYYQQALATPQGVQQELARIGPQGLALVYAQLAQAGGAPPTSEQSGLPLPPPRMQPVGRTQPLAAQENEAAAAFQGEG